MDSYRHKGLRLRLVELMIEKGIADTRLLQAMIEVPRHLFLDKAFEEWAYKDQAFPIAMGQTISHPYTVAYQTQLLKVNSTDKILEIGLGSGYQAAILSLIGGKIYSIERHRQLYEKTTLLLKKIGYQSVRTLHGDGYLGAERFAPFDKILVTAGASVIPENLLSQLKVGGLMVIPLGDGHQKGMTRIIKTSSSSFETETFGAFEFVPFLEGIK